MCVREREKKGAREREGDTPCKRETNTAIERQTLRDRLFNNAAKTACRKQIDQYWERV